MTDNAAKKARARRRLLLEPLARLLSDPHGRAYLYSVITATPVFYHTTPDDPLLMAYREGTRNFGLRLIEDAIEANEDAYHLMLKEGRHERTTDARGDATRDPLDDDSGTDDDC